MAAGWGAPIQGSREDDGQLRPRAVPQPALAVLGVVGLAAIAAFTYRYTQVPDDSYIFYRYARNLANGEGWVYNPTSSDGNGATSPAWTVVMAVVALFTDNVLVVGSVISAGLMVTAAATTTVSLRAIGRPIEGLVAAPLVMMLPILASVRGMESPLMLATIALLLHFGLVRPRPIVAGAMAGLLTLARPEGAMLAVVVAVICWRRDGRFPFRMAIAGTLALVPWVVYSTIAIGTPVSGTLAAKVAQERSGLIGPPFSFLRHVGQLVSQPWSLLLLLLALVGVVALASSRTVEDYFVGLVGYAVLHVIAYGLIIRPPAYPWYYSIEYFTMAVLAAVGLVGIAQLLSSQAPEPRRSVVRAGVVVVGLAVLAGLSYQGYRKVDWYVGYRAAGDYLRENTRPTDRVGACEIGVVGWYSERPIVDYLGLLDTRSADEFRRRDLTSWFLRSEPEYYVAHIPAWSLEVPSLATDEFAAAYEPVFETGDLPWSRLRIYRRVSDGEGPGTASPLLSARWVDEFDDAGVTLEPDEQRAMGELLARFVASTSLQQEFDTADGVDVPRLVRAVTQEPDGVAPSAVAVLETLAERLEGTDLVLPLAPRSGAPA